MITLKEIKEYLKNAKTEELVSKRGNKYKVVKVNKKILDRIFEFKSLRKSIHSVNDKYIYSVVWFEKGKRIEVIVMEEK
jgi:predicted transcriptional regulator